MAQQLNFEIKEQMVSLAGACFWFWNSFHSFLESSGVRSSLYQQYPKGTFNKYEVMRNILRVLDENRETETIKRLVSNFYRLRNAVDPEKLDTARARQLLEQFRETVGDDPIEAAIKERQREKTRANYESSVESKAARNKRLSDLNKQFQEMAGTNELTPQQRGFKLESLFFELLHLEELEHTKPYRTPGREQIDGHFKFEKFDYLVEVKWIQGQTKQPALSIFDGKIRGKAQSTRGLFLAAEGFDDTSINKFSGDAPRIVLMTGEDLALILDGSLPLFDVMKAKIDAIVRYGEINFGARNIVVA